MRRIYIYIYIYIRDPILVEEENELFFAKV